MTDGPDGTPRQKRRQMNVRLPEELIDTIDNRRAALELSRDTWVERALKWAVSQPPPAPPTSLRRTQVARTEAGRTFARRRPAL